MKNLFTVLAIALLTLTSCSKDSTEDVVVEQTAPISYLSVTGVWATNLDAHLQDVFGFETYALDFGNNENEVDAYGIFDGVIYEAGYWNVSDRTENSLRLNGSGSNYIDITFKNASTLIIYAEVEGEIISGDLKAINL